MKWEKLKLKDVCVKVTKGTTPTTYGFPFVERGINYIKAESILPDYLFFDHIKRRVKLRWPRTSV